MCSRYEGDESDEDMDGGYQKLHVYFVHFSFTKQEILMRERREKRQVTATMEKGVKARGPRHTFGLKVGHLVLICLSLSLTHASAYFAAISV